MKRIVFSPDAFGQCPEKSFVLKFPQFTLSIMTVGNDIYAELIEGSSRETFKGVVDDDKKEFKKIIDNVMKELGTVLMVDHKK